MKIKKFHLFYDIPSDIPIPTFNFIFPFLPNMLALSPVTVTTTLCNDLKKLIRVHVKFAVSNELISLELTTAGILPVSSASLNCQNLCVEKRYTLDVCVCVCV